MLVFPYVDWRFLRLWHFIVGCYFNGYICIFVTFSSGRIMFFYFFIYQIWLCLRCQIIDLFQLCHKRF